MRPLDSLAAISSIARLLKSSVSVDVRTELERVAQLSLGEAERAALEFARGSIALRDGSLEEAFQCFDRSSTAFETIGEQQASMLARAEAWLSLIRRGPRSVYGDAISELGAIASSAGDDRLVEVVATHYRATAERMLGDPLATQRSLRQAFSRSEELLEERAQILNSMGTLYVVMGAFGAAQSVLEHAAELHRRSGDALGEAIAHGQLGSAALAQGKLELARTHLQKQEWFASRIGDAFGRARALVFLADLALDAGRPDDAVELSNRARAVATSVEPPLDLWLAYATRAAGRARVELGESEGVAELERAAGMFAEFGNPLGEALTAWDLARAREGRGDEGAEGWFAPAWTLASLGLASRVAKLLDNVRSTAVDCSASSQHAREQTIAAVARGAAYMVDAQELRLAYGDPESLASVASRRGAAERNLARLSALTLAPPGLFIAVLRADARIDGLPSQRAKCAAVAELGAASVWVWPLATPLEDVVRDLGTLATAPGARIALWVDADARIATAPFHGEVGARAEGVDVVALLSASTTLGRGVLAVDEPVAWTEALDGAAARLGFRVERTSLAVT